MHFYIQFQNYTKIRYYSICMLKRISAEALHPMDCVDMVIGMAVGNLHRIGDYYSISRATPREDSFYNGSDSLVAAYGYEEDGITTIMFKKPLTASDKADRSFEKGPMHVIWAWGQDPINYLHDPPSALEASPVGKPETFYGNDVLRYHGILNRGMLTVNFFGKRSTLYKKWISVGLIVTLYLLLEKLVRVCYFLAKIE